MSKGTLHSSDGIHRRPLPDRPPAGLSWRRPAAAAATGPGCRRSRRAGSRSWTRVNQVLGSRTLWRCVLFAENAHFVATLHLAANINLRRRIVPDQQDGQPRANTGGRHHLDFRGDFRANVGCDFRSIKNGGRHWCLQTRDWRVDVAIIVHNEIRQVALAHAHLTSDFRAAVSGVQFPHGFQGTTRNSGVPRL